MWESTALKNDKGPGRRSVSPPFAGVNLPGRIDFSAVDKQHFSDLYSSNDASRPNTLYRQIILNNGLPFPLVLPRATPSRDAMTGEEFDAMMRKSPEQAKAGQGMDIEEAFAKIGESI